MLIYDHHMGGFATRLLLFADAIQIIDTFRQISSYEYIKGLGASGLILYCK